MNKTCLKITEGDRPVDHGNLNAWVDCDETETAEVKEKQTPGAPENRITANLPKTELSSKTNTQCGCKDSTQISPRVPDPFELIPLVVRRKLLEVRHH